MTTPPPQPKLKPKPQVYVLTGNDHYEHTSWCQGVFSTLHLAEAALARHEYTNPVTGHRRNDYEIDELTLDKEIS